MHLSFAEIEEKVYENARTIQEFWEWQDGLGVLPARRTYAARDEGDAERLREYAGLEDEDALYSEVHPAMGLHSDGCRCDAVQRAVAKAKGKWQEQQW